MSDYTTSDKKRRSGGGGWNKGLPAWNRGLKWSDDVKQHISEGMKRNHSQRVNCHCFACDAETRRKTDAVIAAKREAAVAGENRNSLKTNIITSYNTAA